MIGIFISKRIQNEKNDSSIDRQGNPWRRAGNQTRSDRHQDQHKGLNQQMPYGNGGQVAHHGGGHQNSKDYAHNRVLYTKYHLKHIDK